MTKSEALQKLKKYCAYQERSHSEVRTKLISLEVYGDTLEEVIFDLVQEDYLNEERFARSYARGKHRIKKWGRDKITQSLKLKRVSEYCIKKAMTEIDPDLYVETLQEVLKKYYKERKSKYDSHTIRVKLIQHAVSKGYEYHLVKAHMQDIMTEQER
jgi:regulatory protein